MNALAVQPVDWLTAMLSHDFIRHAVLAGTGVALASGLAGYVVVLRNQVFTGESLSHVAFTGAAAALAAGVEPLAGLFGASVAVALAMSLLGGGARSRDVTTGTIFAWVLGLGVLFLSLYTSNRSAGGGGVGVSVLFGSIYGLSLRSALIAAATGLGVAVALVALARPLLFASVDADVAAARGVPVRALGLVFLALVGLTVAEAVQAVGALLSVGLVVTPAAAVHRVCTRPLTALGLSAALAVACLWGGLLLSYAADRLPPSFTVIALAFAAYLAAVAVPPMARRARRPA